MDAQIGATNDTSQGLPGARRPAHLHGAWTKPPFLSGKLLLAMPGMADPRFERAVIALCVHDENGAVGIGIGHKRAGMRFRGLLRQLDIDPGEAPDCAGPSRRAGRAGQGLRAPFDDWGGQDTLAVVGPNGTVRDDRHDRRAARRSPRAEGPAQWIVALGYAGWGEGQLEEEMTRHGWFAADGEPDDPVRHADRRALGGGVQGRRRRSAAARRARPARPEINI